ncbi:MAG: hypothetical protein ACFFG0_06285 [Candidatus Thorarchaeota archaeon]
MKKEKDKLEILLENKPSKEVMSQLVKNKVWENDIEPAIDLFSDYSEYSNKKNLPQEDINNILFIMIATIFYKGYQEGKKDYHAAVLLSMANTLEMH